MKTHANISPEKLIEICNACIKAHEEVVEGRVALYTEKRFSFSKMRYEYIDCYGSYPRWATRGCGLITRLQALRSIALAIIEDEGLVDRDIKLSETTYSELIKMYNKSESFEPYVFAGGY